MAVMEGNYIALPACQYCPPSPPMEVGKPPACCDPACIEVAAQRECDAESYTSSITIDKQAEVTETSNCAGGCCSEETSTANNKKAAARTEKLKAARERYAATLEAVGCICRALLARNLETCCSPQTKRSLRSATPRTSTSSSSLRASTSGCCSAKEASACSKRKMKADTHGKNAGIGGGSGSVGDKVDDSKTLATSCSKETGCCDNPKLGKPIVKGTSIPAKTGCPQVYLRPRRTTSRRPVATVHRPPMNVGSGPARLQQRLDAAVAKSLTICWLAWDRVFQLRERTVLRSPAVPRRTTFRLSKLGAPNLVAPRSLMLLSRRENAPKLTMVKRLFQPLSSRDVAATSLKQSLPVSKLTTLAEQRSQMLQRNLLTPLNPVAARQLMSPLTLVLASHLKRKRRMIVVIRRRSRTRNRLSTILPSLATSTLKKQA